MNQTNGTAADVRAALENKLTHFFGVSTDEATFAQVYGAVILTVRDILSQKKDLFHRRRKTQQAKKVYYLCMEFLIGPSLQNNLRNLGLEDQYRDVLKEMDINLDDLYESEPDPGLGNGGLGRLAACFMDALTTQEYAATGFSLCYEYGFFKQRIIEGNQVELPDDWLPGGRDWLIARPDKTVSVRMGGKVHETWNNGHCEISYEDCEEVHAVPYDMLISGKDSDAVSTLRLWRAQDPPQFNMKLFSQGQYVNAMEKTTSAEVISKVLYPSDNHQEGKLLRLTQQYFLVSASLQNIIQEHLAVYGTLSNFAQKVALHINDTHPALVVPELMRILMDVYSYCWDDAWHIVTQTVSYTNHTVLPEALECWNVDLFRLRLPRIYMIVEEINRRLCADLWARYPGDWDRISRMSIIAYNQVRMANLCVAASHTVNGVSALHSEILTRTIFHDYYKTTPEKFTNVTNGIAHRRWLCYSNAGLSNLLNETIGTDYVKQPWTLQRFKSFADDTAVLDRLSEIKYENKCAFAAHIAKKYHVTLDPHSVFDVQVKRIHEYKRQLLNALKIIDRCLRIKDMPNGPWQPVTFVFGGKAAPGYSVAKDIIKLICHLGTQIDKDPVLQKLVKVLYVEDYSVSVAQHLMPASDISEQISLAGKEASGTGCMKFMINGALTLGTLDGANVEIKEAVGPDNIYIFGMDNDEVDALWRSGYVSLQFYQNNPALHRVLDRMGQGFDGVDFSAMEQYLLHSGGGVADPFMCLADFDSYVRTFDHMLADYEDPHKWQKKALINIAQAGVFSADRAVKEYAEHIWHINPVTETDGIDGTDEA